MTRHCAVLSLITKNITLYWTYSVFGTRDLAKLVQSNINNGRNIAGKFEITALRLQDLRVTKCLQRKA